MKGLPAYRFSPPGEVFANTTANAGFCVPPRNCPGSGLLDVSVCKEGEKESRHADLLHLRWLFCIQELPSSCPRHTSTRRRRSSWRLFLG